MSFRDVQAMLQCLFYVNDLPGGEAHHDGGMKGRDAPGRCCRTAMLALTAGRDRRASTHCARSRRARSSRRRARRRERPT